MVEYSAEISEDEAALYDRQIRLWGVDAQKRLHAASVLVAGLQGLGAEVAKNVVLAGVKSITLVDHNVVTEDDFASQFLITREDLGKNRAECSQNRVQLLNPNVDVRVNTTNIDDWTSEEFKNFNVVCIIGAQKDTVLKINKFCREFNIKFFAGEVYGFFGFMFTDLGEHEYSEEVPVAPPKTEDTEEPAQKKIKLAAPETKVVKKEINYVTFEDAIGVQWNTEAALKLLKKLTASYFIMQVLLEFKKVQSRRPTRDSKELDVSMLINLKNTMLSGMEVPTNKVEDRFASSCFSELSPVCAIIGGVFAQEVIKAVAQKDQPHKNFFFYNGLEGSGVVENVQQ